MLVRRRSYWGAPPPGSGPPVLGCACASAASRVALLAWAFTACSGSSPAHRSLEPAFAQPSSEPALPEQPAVARYELGALPDQLGVVRWPAAPRITHEQDVPAREELVIDRAGTRVRVRGTVDRILVRADDVEIRADAGVHVGHLVLERGIRRLRVSGGRYGAIELPVPARHHPPPPVWHREWLVEDITVDGVEVDAPDTAFALRGRRIAVLRSRVRAERYSVWCGDTHDFWSEDIVLAGNRFESAGPEATIRLVSVRRAVVVDNVLDNTLKHDFRVHGESDQVVFARNRVLSTGLMIGSMDGDRIGTVWVLENTVHHTAPSLFEVDPRRVRRLVARDNVIFTDRWRCFPCGRAGAEWEIVANRMAPYRPPDPE